jgi:hypothetical protein
MAEQINLIKQVFNKNQYQKVIDTSFTQLVQSATSSITTPTISIQQFFEYYQQLFLTIPKLGDINSHSYIIMTSSDYIGANIANDDLIQSLIEEINTLRQENLDLQQTVIDITKTQ